MDVVDHLLRAPASLAPIATLGAWFEHLERCPFERAVDRALWAGFEADRLGHAFVGGYRAALAQLFVFASTKLERPLELWPKASTRLSLAATEAGGAHPRSIQTTLADVDGKLHVRGEKTFATLASSADELLVVASTGASEGQNRLRLVRIRADASGVTIEDRAPTPFAPEVPHARIKLDVIVRGEDVLPGDGYDVYLKPFRTVEDTHVLAATLGNVVRAARAHGFDRAVTENAIAMALAVREIAARDPADPVAHVALSGLFQAARKHIADHDGEWEKADQASRERWRRDLPLLLIAETVRLKRTEAAWATLGYAADR